MKESRECVIEYFNIHEHDMDHIGTIGDFEIFQHLTTTFVHVVTSDDDFIETPYWDLKHEFEKAVMRWSIEHADEFDSSFIITCDEICVVMLNKDRALIRHTVNVFNKEV